MFSFSHCCHYYRCFYYCCCCLWCGLYPFTLWFCVVHNCNENTLSYSKYHPSGVITLIIISKCLRFCWGFDVFLAVDRFVSFTSLHHRNYHPFCCSQLRGDTTQRYAKYIFHFAGAHWLFDIDNALTVHPTHRNATQMSLEVRFWWRKK